MKPEDGNKKSPTAQRTVRSNEKNFFSSRCFYIVYFSVLTLILICLTVAIYFSLSLPNDATYMQKKAFDIFAHIIYTGFTALIGLMVGKYTMGKENVENK